jgi:hypothetical protein
MQILKRSIGHRFALATVVFTALAAGTTKVGATALPIADDGVLQLGNMAGSLFAITSSPGCINWIGGSTCVAGTAHSMSVSGSSNLFLFPSSGTIKDLTSLTPGSVTAFETASGGGALVGQTINLDLVSFVLGAGAGNCNSDAAFNFCNPAGSAFSLAEDSSGTQVSVSFTALLNAYTGTNGSGTSSYRAIFTSQYSGALIGSGGCSGLSASITNILSCEGEGGSVSSTWSATESPIISSVPEPFSFTLVASGLLGLAFYGCFARRVG